MNCSHRGMILALAIASSCGGKTEVSRSVVDGGMAGHAGWSSVVCMRGDEPIAVGKAYGDGCNTCTCTASGVFDCSQIDCNTGCFFGSVWLKLGQSAANPSDGGTCTCTSMQVVCTTIPFGTSCVYREKTYASGESFVDSDGCSNCSCLGATVSCSSANCTNSCNFAGTLYAQGTQFPSPDGCNQCACDRGSVTCTANPCPCKPQREYYRNYLAFDANQCSITAVSCAAGTALFANECGCGCEQSLSCPEYFDCPARIGTGGAGGTSSTGGSGGTGGPVSAATGGSNGAGTTTGASVFPPCPTPEQKATCPLSKTAN